MNFTDQQWDFIEERKRHVIVLAIPGAGKTSTLVGKLLDIIEDGQTVTAVTFTKDAAKTLKNKTFDNIPEGWKNRCKIGTFHSLAQNWLRSIPGSPLHGRKIMSDGVTRKQRSIVLGVFFESVADEMHLWFDIAYTCLGDPYGLKAAEAIPLDNPDRAEKIQVAHTRRDIIDVYEKGLLSNGLFDIGRIMLTALEYAEKGYRFFNTDHLMVDEFQDVDEVQLRLIILASRASRVDVVGDDDQSVYKFRAGLGYEAFQLLRSELKPRMINFSENFRCKASILFWAECVIEQNKIRYSKTLHAKRGPGGETRLIQLDKDSEETLLVAKMARLAVTNGAKSVAIICRNKVPLVEIQFDLTRLGVEFHRVACDSIWDEHPCSTAVALLESLEDPKGSIVGFEHTLYLFGANEKEIVLLREAANGHAIMKSFATLRNVAAISDTCRAAMDRLISLLERINYSNTSNSSKKADYLIGEVFGIVADTLKLNSRLKERQRDVQLDILRNSETILKGIRGSLAQRLAVIQRQKENSSDVPVHLTTMHGSKGLEFNSVFIIHAADHVIPGKTRIKEEIEEERRLLYVAMTRARDELTITCSRKYGSSKWKPQAFMTTLLMVKGSPREQCLEDYQWVR